jgi:hypothetical protein
MVPDEIALHFSELDVRIVKVTSDLRREVLRKRPKLLSQIHNLDAHSNIVAAESAASRKQVASPNLEATANKKTKATANAVAFAF